MLADEQSAGVDMCDRISKTRCHRGRFFTIAEQLDVVCGIYSDVAVVVVVFFEVVVVVVVVFSKLSPLSSSSFSELSSLSLSS